MSNHEESLDIEEEIYDDADYSDSSCCADAGEIREIVLALPALSIRERSDDNVDEKISEEAVTAAELIVEAAKEAEEKENTEQTVSETGDAIGSPLSKKPRVLSDDLAEAVGSVASGSVEEGESMMEPRKKVPSKLLNPPPGFPPKSTFTAAEEGFGDVIAASSSGAGLGIDPNVAVNEEVRRGTGFVLPFDLNEVPDIEEEEVAREDDE